MTRQVDLAMVGHEIRTSLGGVLGMLDLLGSTRLDEEQRQLIESAEASGRMLQGLLADILDLSRPKAESVRLHLCRFHPSRLVRDVQTLLQRQAAGRGISFECRVSPQVPENLVGDPLRIQQVMINLCVNAIKFTDRGYVRLSLDSDQRPGSCILRITVEDSGVGIPPWQIEKIFEPYYQVTCGRGGDQKHDEASKPECGVGLGLAITRRLVDAMRGEIEVESQPRIGSTFRVSLPLELSIEAPTDPFSLKNLSAHVASHEPALLAPLLPPRIERASLNIQAEAEAAFPPQPLRDLVADDNPINRLLLDRHLQKLGYHVDLCETGDEALELWKRQQPDILFADLYMPGMGGLDLIRAIRQSESASRVHPENSPTVAFLVSAAQSNAVSVEALAAGFDGLLPKPFRFADFARLVAGLPERGRSNPRRSPESSSPVLVA